jgi:CPA2 family monovalent cation:H+ antiporter-2
MPHQTPLITTIVAGLGLAFVFGALAQRLKLSPLVGYLLAGALVGPSTPGYVADLELAPQLAELGVILLMFGVGMHFSLKDLLSVKHIAVPGALAQIAVATLLGMGLSSLLGWSLGAGIVFGLALSVASTVVLLRALEERSIIDTDRGRIAIGWLVVEDLAMVLALVLLPALAGPLSGERATEHEALGPTSILLALALTLGKVAAFVALMLLVGRRVVPWLLHVIAATGSRELFRLAVLAIGLGIAFGSAELFGVSFALGAFFAGMVLNESELSHRAAEESLPLRDAFAVLFFVSVGMLFDPAILLRDPWLVLATLLIIVLGKSVAALLIVLAFRHPMSTALTIAASLAQIGEFSFILAALGLELGLLPKQGQDLIVTGAILSIITNPLFFVLSSRIAARWEQRHPQAAAAAPAEPNEPVPASGHAIVVGFGRVGSMLSARLQAAGVPTVVVEQRPELAERAREAGLLVVSGNCARTGQLDLAALAEARCLFVAIPNGFEAGQIVEQARKLRPDLLIVARAHSDEELKHLEKLGASQVLMSEHEIARGMLGLAQTASPTLPASPQPA